MSESTVEGLTVVITGAASGIGKALAQGFLRDGALVLACDISEQGLVDLDTGGAMVERTDVTRQGEVQAVIERAHRETGRVDVLFNNAGHGSYRSVAKLRDDEFERMMRVHVFGALYGMRFALPIMREQGFGRIINTLSRAAETCGPKNSAYSAAKAALWAATRSAATENTDVDILISGLIPGPTNTGIWGRDMPKMQSPEAVYPTARMLATLPAGSKTGEVYWDEKVYPLMDPRNDMPDLG